MELMQELEEAIEQLDKIGYKNSLSIVDGEIYFRWDTEESDSRGQWDNYVSIMEDLRNIGYFLDDSCTEHNCITGILKFEVN